MRTGAVAARMLLLMTVKARVKIENMVSVVSLLSAVVIRKKLIGDP